MTPTVLAADGDVDTIAGLAFVLGLAALVVVLVVVLLKRGVQLAQARTATGQDRELRALLERSTSAQERQAAVLEDLSQRLSTVERVLKDVE
jgi:uncharacterized protein YoxC